MEALWLQEPETSFADDVTATGKFSDPVRASRLVGRMADKRLAFYRRRRADPCQLALYAHWHHADEQEDRGCRLEAADPTSRTMIETWGRLHAVRTSLGIAASLAYLSALL